MDLITFARFFKIFEQMGGHGFGSIYHDIEKGRVELG